VTLQLRDENSMRCAELDAAKAAGGCNEMVTVGA
jgi:hypothetical protein